MKTVILRNSFHFVGRFALVMAVLGISSASAQTVYSVNGHVMPEGAIASKTDVWGDEAMAQRNGPSYEFFEKILPPLRFVNADFLYYPIVLSAPNSPQKARLISNGSAINARGGTRSWNDIGTPVNFRVGPDELRFGEYPQRLEHPQYAEGWLPIVSIHYEHGEAVYREESFASVDPTLAAHGVVFVKFSLRSGSKGNVAVQIDAKSPVKAGTGIITDDQGKALVWFDNQWKWTRQVLTAVLNATNSVTLAVATQPIDAAAPNPVISGGYIRQRQLAEKTWRGVVQTGMQVEVPEPVVNNAWRSLLVGTCSLIHSNRMFYSAGNQYEKLYQAEGCDATQSLLLWGFTNDTRRLIPAQLAFTRKGLEFHQAGQKLLLLTHYYHLTHDAEFIKSQRSSWEKEINLIVNQRTNALGLFPREQYCGDIATPVYSLNSNSKCWRALRDFSALLAELGETEESKRLADVAQKFRTDIIAAVEKSEHRETQPPFIPIALSGEEQPYDPITGTKIGSYWNLMINYVMGSGVFGPGSEREQWMMEYLQQHGGLSMGLIRSRPAPTFWTGLDSLNPLYGLRYVLTVLQRDDPERALVSFYGMLAQGFTRNTFIAAEGGSMRPLNENGRIFYLPPNSAGNAFFLWMLRYVMVQDWDLNDDGSPETLRLMFATPRGWLEEGKTINIQHAPTAFGEVSVRMQSHLSTGEVVAEVEAPSRLLPRQTWLRARVPEGWEVASAQSGGVTLKTDAKGTVDVSTFKGKYTVRFAVQKTK